MHRFTDTAGRQGAITLIVATVIAVSPSLAQAADAASSGKSGGEEKTASATPGGLAPADLASRLETAKQQEERFDIELRSGKSYIRCKLLRLDRAGASGPPKMLRVETEDARKPVSIDFASIRSLAIGREVMYDAPLDKKSAARSEDREGVEGSRRRPRPMGRQSAETRRRALAGVEQ